MKILKLNHASAERILQNESNSTIRLFDDKDISVNDEVELLDKVDPHNRTTWVPIGIARIRSVLEKTVGALTEHELVAHGYASAKQFIHEFEDYYGRGIDDRTAVKIIEFNFVSGQQTEQADDKKTTEITEVKLFADGGSRGNPGPSAAGYVLYDMNNSILHREGVYLGITTNNQAEYLALKLGLEQAKKSGARIVHVYLDSLLVVNQMNGKFKVKNRDLWPIHGAIKELVPAFEQVHFTHVPRELNKEADAAVNEVMDIELAKQHTV